MNASSESGTADSTDTSSDTLKATATPCTNRELAQLRQIARSLVCLHPQQDLRIRLLDSGGGYIEWCPHCMRVTDLWEN